ncbi:hypothetical protein E2C01_022536 [Portunus trituberculatus]|uniref:Uncharacterized protein n=1 Tax=Portunus trituberculatus TaxID=210409 RepID=A0A5B7E7B8_PORTR|nr:hypothetical protein [Portunus trituberculatus]
MCVASCAMPEPLVCGSMVLNTVPFPLVLMWLPKALHNDARSRTRTKTHCGHHSAGEHFLQPILTLG